MAQKKVSFEIDVDGKSLKVAVEGVNSLSEKLRVLKKQLQSGELTTAQFEALSQEIGDVEDQIAKTNVKSKDFLGTLQLLPGPIGAFANSADNAIATLKVFGGISLKDIRFQLGETLNDFKDIASSIGKATGISKVYTTINNALAKSFVAVGVGEQAAAVGAKAFASALVATGIGAAVVAIGLLVDMLMKLASGEEEAAIATEKLNRELEYQNLLFDLNEKSSKRIVAEALARMKAQGKSEAEIRKFQIDQAYKDYQAARQAEQDAIDLFNKNREKASDEDLKKLQDNLNKRNQATKDAYSNYLVIGYNARAQELSEEKASAQKLKDQRVNDLKAANDLLKDLKNQNSVLTLEDEKARQAKELENAKKAEEEKIKALLINEKLKNDLLEQVKIKYAAKQADIDKKQAELASKEQRELTLFNIESQLKELDRQMAKKQDDFLTDLQILELKKIKLEEARDFELSNTELTELEKLKIKEKYAEESQKIEQDQMQVEQDMLKAREANRQAVIGLSNSVGQLAMAFGQETIAGKALIKVQQALALSTTISALADQFKGIGQAIKLPFPANIVAVTATLGTMAAAVAQFKALFGIGPKELSKGGGGSSSSETAPSLGKNYAQGGFIKGPRHAQGGVMIEAEGGEAVMTRGAVTMFGPLLSAMNQMGGGTSFANNMVSSPDVPETTSSAMNNATPIIKTYVVSSELTSEAERQARLKDLSVL